MTRVPRVTVSRALPRHSSARPSTEHSGPQYLVSPSSARPHFLHVRAAKMDTPDPVSTRKLTLLLHAAFRHRPSVLKLRSMNPSLQGWYGVVLVLCIPNRRHTSSTTFDPKFVPWSLCSSRKAPYRATISYTNILATVVAF